MADPKASIGTDFWQLLYELERQRARGMEPPASRRVATDEKKRLWKFHNLFENQLLQFFIDRAPELSMFIRLRQNTL